MGRSFGQASWGTQVGFSNSHSSELLRRGCACAPSSVVSRYLDEHGVSAQAVGYEPDGSCVRRNNPRLRLAWRIARMSRNSNQPLLDKVILFFLRLRVYPLLARLYQGSCSASSGPST